MNDLSLFSLQQLEAATAEDIEHAKKKALPDATLAALNHLEANLYKKATSGCSAADRTFYRDGESRRVAACVDLFLANNRKMCAANEIFRQCTHLSYLGESDQLALATARQYLTRWCADLNDQLSDPSAVLAPVLKVGPGTALHASALNAYSKVWDSPLSFPSKLAVRVYEGLTANDCLLGRAEATRASWHGAPFVDSVARFSSVPKDRNKRRSIIIPTNGGAMLARGLGVLLEEVLAKIGMPISTQPVRNRAYAYQGSVDGSFCTIDWSSASDLIARELVIWLFSDLPNLLKLMLALRDERCVIDDTTVVLEAFSGMGNGFTFPLQTLVFASLAYGNYEAKLERMRSVGLRPGQHFEARPRKWLGVFGDDVVVHRSADPEGLIGLTQCLFMEPNPDKSYTQGAFRESCGTDWASGYNIRSPYARDLREVGDRVSLLNQLLAWCSFWDVSLAATIGILVNSIPKQRLNAVPLWEASDSGLRMPSRFVAMRAGAYSPWRKNQKKVPICNDRSTFTIEVRTNRGRPVKIANPDGYMAFVLLGSEARHYAVERSSQSRYKTNPTRTFGWDTPPWDTGGWMKFQLPIFPGGPAEAIYNGTSIDRRIAREFCLPGRPEDWHGYWARLATSPRFLLVLEEELAKV